MKAKSTRSRITWKLLDSLKSSEHIAALLEDHGIKGIRQTPIGCPLARATGWFVYSDHRSMLPASSSSSRPIPLTKAERSFVNLFDRGKFSDLVGFRAMKTKLL